MESISYISCHTEGCSNRVIHEDHMGEHTGSFINNASKQNGVTSTGEWNFQINNRLIFSWCPIHAL